MVQVMNRIPVAGPWITQKEIDYVTDAVTHAWYGNANMYHERFEEAFRTYLGVKYAMALPSCTSAIHLSLLALGIGPGDEVVVPDTTWIASAAPITYVGATPVFADIDPDSWCLSPASFERCITPRTRAIIPVDLYGNVANYAALQEIADRHGISIVEDAAEALGAEFDGRKAGSLGECGVFSFHGSKTITSGEGGMLVTDREDLFKRASFLRDHGRAIGDKMFWNDEVAYRYRMSSMQAALGLAQLERIDELLARKIETFNWYAAELADMPDVRLNYQAPHTTSTYWMVTVVLGSSYSVSKERLIAEFKKRNIDTRPFFYPLSSMPAYEHLEQAKTARSRNETAYRISPSAINLPSALSLTKEQVHFVCATLREIVEL
jgi:perosamine synthetase